MQVKLRFYLFFNVFYQAEKTWILLIIRYNVEAHYMKSYGKS